MLFDNEETLQKRFIFRILRTIDDKINAKSNKHLRFRIFYSNESGMKNNEFLPLRLPSYEESL